MKHIYLYVMSLLIPAGLFGQGLTTQTFLDFNTFEEKIQETYPNPDNQLLNVEGQAIAELGSEFFMLDNWLVSLTNSSGENPVSQRDSYSKKVTSGEQGTVLGIRINFPNWPYSGEVVIKPSFPLLPFTKEGVYANINNGVVTNVGRVKSFSLWANGRNFPFSVGVRATDMKDKLTEFGLGSLKYIGWRKLVYNNSLFSDKAFNNLLPSKRIYPNEIPLLKFKEIAIYKPHNTEGGDFVGYFGGMDIEYIPYITENTTDIDDEQTWGLIQTEQERRASAINDILYEEILQFEYAKQRVQQNNNNENNNNNQ